MDSWLLNFLILKSLSYGFLIIDSKLLVLDYSKFRNSKFLYFKFQDAIPNSNLFWFFSLNRINVVPSVKDWSGFELNMKDKKVDCKSNVYKRQETYRPYGRKVVGTVSNSLHGEELLTKSHTWRPLQVETSILNLFHYRLLKVKHSYCWIWTITGWRKLSANIFTNMTPS